MKIDRKEALSEVKYQVENINKGLDIWSKTLNKKYYNKIKLVKLDFKEVEDLFIDDNIKTIFIPGKGDVEVI